MPSFQPEQLSRITDERLDRAEAAYTVIVALEQKVEATEARRASFGRDQQRAPRRTLACLDPRG